MRQVSVGDTVLYQPWGGEPKTATVMEIEVCKRGEKYGRVVNNCNIDLYDNGTLILCGHRWCYFYQSRQIIKNGKDKENDPHLLEIVE